MRVTIGALLVAGHRTGYSFQLGHVPLAVPGFDRGEPRHGQASQCVSSQRQRDQRVGNSPSKVVRRGKEKAGTTGGLSPIWSAESEISESILETASFDLETGEQNGGDFTERTDGVHSLEPDAGDAIADGCENDEEEGELEAGAQVEEHGTEQYGEVSAVSTAAAALSNDGVEPFETHTLEEDQGASVGRGGREVGSLDGLTADEVEQKLISAGILRADGADIDLQEGDEDDAGGGGMGVYNEIEVSDGEEAGRILEDRLGFDEEGIAYLRSKYPPLRGELWYRREPVAGGAKTGKKFLDVFFLEETLPDLFDLLLGGEDG
ncbi:unnamed protein product, partial [Scytosiphon promiscuus]